MNLILFYLQLQTAPSWENAIVWIQLNHTGIICCISSFAGAIASYPFIDKKMTAKIWQYTFTSWSTGFAISFLAADKAELGIPATIFEAFGMGLGGFYAARQLFNRNKDKDVNGQLIHDSNSTTQPDERTNP